MTFYAMTYAHTGEWTSMEIVINDPVTGDWTDPSDDDLWGERKKSIYDPCPRDEVPVSDASGVPYDWMKFASMTWDNNTNMGAIQDVVVPQHVGHVRILPEDVIFNQPMHMELSSKHKRRAASDLSLYPTLYGRTCL